MKNHKFWIVTLLSQMSCIFCYCIVVLHHNGMSFTKKKINLAFRPAVQLWINDEFPSNYLALVHRLNVFLALNYELQFKRSALFCDFTQRRLVVCFRSFGEAYRFDLQWVQHCLTLRKLPWQTANLHCVRSQKSAYFFYTAAESWNRVKLRT